MKIAKRHYRIDNIIENMENGNWQEAKRLTQYKCKTLPEKQAYRVGLIVGALMDTDNRNNPDMAVRFLNLFD